MRARVCACVCIIAVSSQQFQALMTAPITVPSRFSQGKQNPKESNSANNGTIQQPSLSHSCIFFIAVALSRLLWSRVSVSHPGCALFTLTTRRHAAKLTQRLQSRSPARSFLPSLDQHPPQSLPRLSSTCRPTVSLPAAAHLVPPPTRQYSLLVLAGSRP